jgi:hypothetical protein
VPSGSLTGPNIMGTKDIDYELISHLRRPRHIFWWLSGFIFIKENDSKINWYFGNYFCEGKLPKTKATTSRAHLPGHFRLAGCPPARPLSTSRVPSRVVCRSLYPCMY